MNIDIKDGTKKIRMGEYVIYNVDYLLDHLAQEVAIMENARQRNVAVFDDAIGDYPDMPWQFDNMTGSMNLH